MLNLREEGDLDVFEQMSKEPQLFKINAECRY